MESPYTHEIFANGRPRQMLTIAPTCSSPFPTGVHDAYDVVKWCAASAKPDSSILPGDPLQGFVVGGASAGGNLAAVVCQLGRDEGLSPPLTGQYLCVPALLWTDVRQSASGACSCYMITLT